MQKILSQDNNCPQKDSTECKEYGGVQTVIGITENHLVEVSFTIVKFIALKVPPYTERHVRWCERSKIKVGENYFNFLLLDFGYLSENISQYSFLRRLNFILRQPLFLALN